MSTIVRVAVLTGLHQLWDYFLPDHLQDCQLGSRVWVPLGRRKIIGLIVDFPKNADVDVAKLKLVETLVDAKPLFSKEDIAFYQWLANYYHFPLGEIIQYALPKNLELSTSLVPDVDRVWQLSEVGRQYAENLPKNAHRLKKIFALFLSHAQLNEKAIHQHQLPPAVLKKLLNQGHLIQQKIPKPKRDFAPSPSKVLNKEQQDCVTKIINDMAHFRCSLLQGITGSGKTEVYFSVIDAVLAKRQQVLVLVPEISLTPQTIARFRERFGERVGVFHSSIQETERQQTWQKLLHNELSILIGTRSAIFLPIPTLGLIIIDEEHDGSFKQQDRLRYSARDSAIKRAQLCNIPIILGSATPSLESLYNAEQGKYQHLFLTERANQAKLPSVELIDLRNQKLQNGFSQKVLQAIHECLAAKQQVLVLINRRGYAPILLCHRCGWVAKCEHCDASLTVHFKPYELRCHHCDARRTPETSCSACQNDDLEPFGQGTERCEETLREIFPDTDVIRVDRDTIRKKDSIQKLLAKIQAGNPAILVGTQLLAKGHDFPNITLSVILNIDMGLFSVDFRGIEKMGQLFIQTAGRAGRGENAGRVLVQTHHPQHPLLKFLQAHDYLQFAKALLKERRAAELPPYQFQILIRAESLNPQDARQFLEKLRGIIMVFLKESHKSTLEVLGPVAPIMEKRAGRYRANLLLQSKSRQLLQRAIEFLLERVSKKTTKNLRWAIDVDPQDVV